MTAREVLKRGENSIAKQGRDASPPVPPPLEEQAQLTLFPMSPDVSYAVNARLGIACPCASPAIAAQLNEFFSR